MFAVLPLSQVAYRDRIRATYFGASYREEVAWVGGDGSAVPAAPAPAAPEEGKRGGARGPAQGKEE